MTPSNLSNTAQCNPKRGRNSKPPPPSYSVSIYSPAQQRTVLPSVGVHQGTSKARGWSTSRATLRPIWRPRKEAARTSGIACTVAGGGGFLGSEDPPTDDPERMVRLASIAPGEEGAKAAVEGALTEVRRVLRSSWVDVDRGCISAFNSVVHKSRRGSEKRVAP